MSKIKDIRNRVDFFLRNTLSWSSSIGDECPITEEAVHLQSEVREFLELFSWRQLFQEEKGMLPFDKIVTTDIGARTFVIGPVIEELLQKNGYCPEVHGIEIDAHRRFTNLHTRLDYGRFYSHRMRNGHYHATDFLDWRQPIDIAFMLNPFVTVEPHLNWGLPLQLFRPDQVFTHCFELMTPRPGILVLSSPDAGEFDRAHRLALKTGFKFIEKKQWSPSPLTIQQQPRIGALYRKIS